MNNQNDHNHHGMLLTCGRITTFSRMESPDSGRFLQLFQITEIIPKQFYL